MRKANSNDIKIKRNNLMHHGIEAEIYDDVHLEIFSPFEMEKAQESLNLIGENATGNDLCIEIGCGTGFLTDFELVYFRSVVGIDISKPMLKKARQKLGNPKNLDLLVCDAENLPFKSEVADLVSASSVLHHLPNPFSSILEMNRILKNRGFLYITREPNGKPYSRFFIYFNTAIQFIAYMRSKSSYTNSIVAKLDYSKVDVNYPNGFNLEDLSSFLLSKSFGVLSAYSYHWVFPATRKTIIQNALSRINFLIEKLPFSKKSGRFICVIAEKTNHLR